MTSSYCLMGGDVSRSPSPAMMNAAFTRVGLDAHYFALSVGSQGLNDALAGLKSEGTMGLNVTIPFKSAIVPLLDRLDEVAERIGAVNAVERTREGYVGFNTDVHGIVQSLADAGLTKVRSSLVLGAGGAARAFCEAMSRLGCSSVTVAVRDVGRASAFVAEMRSAFPQTTFRPAKLADLAVADVEVVFNASPMGSFGAPSTLTPERILSPEMTVFDAVYTPVRTGLLSAASRLGCRVIPGYEMLLNQAAAAFERWTGRSAPISVMREALFRTLGVEPA